MIRAKIQRPTGSRVLGFVLAALIAAGLMLAAKPAHADDFTVTNTNDSGNGSLRKAIEDANANRGKDTIKFNIGGSGVKTISPASQLPRITDPVVIDGYSQPGSRINSRASGPIDAVILVELNGINTGAFDDGLDIEASNVVVRGLAINRFGEDQGIFVRSGTKGVRIEGNFIGTDASGTQDRANATGVAISGSKHTIGGASPEARNLISGNNAINVLLLDKGGNKVQGNLMGTQKDGTSVIGGTQTGVSIQSPKNTIGGAEPGAGNVIAHNSQNGISIRGDKVTGNRILGNSIFSNVLGIDLGDNGRTNNDLLDPDKGANNLQNFPVITLAEGDNNGATRITGTLNSTRNKKFTIQFFSNPKGEDEGKTFLGELAGDTAVKTDRQGNASFTFVSQTPVPLADQITATATDSKGNTSEFSTLSASV